MFLADVANQYIDHEKPWELAKQVGQEERLHEVCTTSINLFRSLSLYLKPVLPNLVEHVERFLNIPPLTWAGVNTLLLDHTIQPYQHLAARVDPKAVEAMLAASKRA